MGADLPAEGFFQHKGLIAAAAGGAVAETGLLAILAPAARPVAPQITTLAPLAAYHDLRWVFAFRGPSVAFAGVLVGVLAARAAVDTGLLRLAWPRQFAPPRAGAAFASCAGLTMVAWLLLSPVVTLAFGVAVLPFSWPFLAAMPLMLGIVLALSHGGVLGSWWRRFPPVRTAAWLLACFVGMSVAGALIAHAGALAALGIAAAAGVMNARAWYGLASVAARQGVPVTAAHRMPGLRLLSWIPVAPLCALVVLVAVVGVARMVFTGTIRLGGRQPASTAAAYEAGSVTGHASPAQRLPQAARQIGGAVLVVAGFGSTCCRDAAGLQAASPDMVVRQFSYRGMSAAGQPLPASSSADDLPLPELGDRLAAQLKVLHEQTHEPVDIVAESEGTLAVYAMLARHPGLPVGSLALLSPIVEPGQMGGSADPGDIPGAALTELNHLVGGMSPYGSAGAQQLISSVGEYGARYFAYVHRHEHGRWLAIVPLADALTLPACGLPPGVMVVPAFHGGLLGNPGVRAAVADFLAARPVKAPQPDPAQATLRDAAEALTGAAIPWRIPVTHGACP